MTTIPRDASAKAAARAEARERAGEIDWVSVGRLLRSHLVRWLATRPASTVLLYFATHREASVEEVAVDPSLAAFRWAAPRVEEDGRLTVRSLDAPIEVHRYGFRQPGPECAELDPGEVGMALVPGVAFDRRGGRLGHGKGHYDRLLPTLAGASAIVGVTAERLVSDHRLPTEPHDVAVGWLATERGVRPARRW
jgi:5-formyltetrahydrofolate cyclo-ligase